MTVGGLVGMETTMRRAEAVADDAHRSNSVWRVLTAFVVAGVLLGGGRAFGADVVLTDVQGNRLELRDARLAYERRSTGRFKLNKSGQIYMDEVPEWESTGIKVYQGAGQILVDWSRIRRLTLRRRVEAESRILADMVLRGDASAEQVPVELVNPVEALVGSTSLGRFSIPLTNVASIEQSTSPRSNEQTSVPEMVLKGITVTDRKGVSVVLNVPADFETPWLSLGAGSVTILYSRIKRIEVQTSDASRAALTMGVDVDGQGVVRLELRLPDELKGETSLGTFTISWQQVVSIATQRNSAPSKAQLN
jgi:hypothetical protein